nr:lysophospholipid acyltransferase family protein [Ktedonobacteraceae bacterium]
MGANITMGEKAVKGTLIGSLAYWVIRGLAWLLAHLACRYRISGWERVPTKGALLIVANHLSWFDPLLLSLITTRRVWFFTKAEMFGWPIVGWLCKLTGQIPVYRGEGDRAALERALSYLRDGRAIVFFPEGTVERQEQMIAAHPGIAMLALRSGATLLPVAHTGTRRVLRSGRGWFPRVQIHIGHPYIPVLPSGMARKVGLQEITRELMQHIAEMLPPTQRGIYR